MTARVGDKGQNRLPIGCLLLALLCAIPIQNAEAQAQDCRTGRPVNTLDGIRNAVYACWAPPSADSLGMEITLTFSLRRDGRLLGKPKITWSKLPGTEARQRAFAISVFTALERALPIPLTDSMGGIIAGRPLSFRFISGGIDEPV